PCRRPHPTTQGALSTTIATTTTTTAATVARGKATTLSTEPDTPAEITFAHFMFPARAVDVNKKRTSPAQ
ncbi:hypothetical protein, partial [Candidatus Frankia nodulisporulans]|uniref:hypothetical protein n=1 Tax=Candidatus Frankia nodulisporulans TaxID=2060052 RepID=UPI0037048D27